MREASIEKWSSFPVGNEENVTRSNGEPSEQRLRRTRRQIRKTLLDERRHRHFLNTVLCYRSTRSRRTSLYPGICSTLPANGGKRRDHGINERRRRK